MRQYAHEKGQFLLECAGCQRFLAPEAFPKRKGGAWHRASRCCACHAANMRERRRKS